MGLASREPLHERRFGAERAERSGAREAASLDPRGAHIGAAHDGLPQGYPCRTHHPSGVIHSVTAVRRLSSCIRIKSARMFMPLTMAGPGIFGKAGRPIRCTVPMHLPERGGTWPPRKQVEAIFRGFAGGQPHSGSPSPGPVVGFFLPQALSGPVTRLRDVPNASSALTRNTSGRGAPTAPPEPRGCPSRWRQLGDVGMHLVQDVTERGPDPGPAAGFVADQQAAGAAAVPAPSTSSACSWQFGHSCTVPCSPNPARVDVPERGRSGGPASPEALPLRTRSTRTR